MTIPAQPFDRRPRRARSRLRALSVAVATVGGVATAAVPGMAGATAHHTSLPAATHHPARPAAAVPPAADAYVYGNKPSAISYTPEHGFSFNSSGGGIHIHRSGTGKYSVTFFGLGPVALQGTVDVTAEGLQPAACHVVNWGQDGTGANLVVNVDCFTVTGLRLNAPFMAAFTSGGSGTGTTDFVWANQPATGSYTPDLFYQFNSSGGTNTIKHLGAGQYRVHMPGPDKADGSVKVTAYGPNANFCQVVQWANVTAGQNVFVDCFNASGVPVNNRFTMTFTAFDSFLGDGASHSGYLWANDPTSATYTPDSIYQFDTVGSLATVTKLPPNPGEWETLYPNEADGAQGDQQATAYGSTPAHCIVDGPIGNGTSEQGDVFCFDTSGNLLDTLYTTQWVVG